MKKLLFLALLTFNMQIFANPTVTWSSDGTVTDAAGKKHYVQRFVAKNLPNNVKLLAFNQFARSMRPLNPADSIIELVPGYYAISSPRINNNADSVVIEIDTRGQLVNCCYAPDGVHLVLADDQTMPVNYVRMPLPLTGQPDAAQIFDRNAAVASYWSPGAYDIIPQYKDVQLTGGSSRFADDVEAKFVNTSDDTASEAYSIIVRGNTVTVDAAPARQNAVWQAFRAKVLAPNAGQPIPDAVITDWPDMPWRGLHVDIARNFQTPETMERVLQLMAENRLNRLHFHPVDDEAWRLEIPGLPELTEVGARRGYSADGSEDDHLLQIFAGDGDPDNTTGTSNGYWTRQQFIDFLRKANDLGIQVLPEIESPGHARAAIKAMEARYHRTGDDTYRLIEDGDTSRYTSAQAFHDNVMNPALPGPERFMGKVFDELIAMYAEAGVPMPGIHIGGDEVPRGAWSGAPSVQRLMADNGLDSERQVHAAFVKRMAALLAKRGVKMFGWEEIAVNHGDDFDVAVAPAVGGVNVWHATPDAANQALRRGYDVILGNVNRYYLDMAYSRHPEERGLTWGGTVDEFDALGGYPNQMYTAPDSAVAHPGRVVGIQGQVWSETIRSPHDLYVILLPKMLALAERANNAEPTWTDAQFNAIVDQKERPALLARGYAMHLAQPGIKVVDGTVHMNAPYTDGQIHYTTDGTIPTQASPLYEAPFPMPANAQIRAIYVNSNQISPVTALP